MRTATACAVAGVLTACGASSPPPAAPIPVPASAPAAGTFACFEIYLGADEDDAGAYKLPGPKGSAWVTGPLARRVRVTQARACQVLVEGIWSVCYRVDAKDIEWLKELRADGNEAFAAIGGWNASMCFGPEGYLASWGFDGEADATDMACWMLSGTLPPARPVGPPRGSPGTHVLREHQATAAATQPSRVPQADRYRPK